ncbi:hypothetical protein MMC08_008695 [Hypocenomyce scalaris]|nr:hypothetical protein [Hypocenomyce scalaris]
MSGSISLGIGIYDIDLSLWFFAEKQTLSKHVFAFGIAALHPKLLAAIDQHNAVGVIEYYGGKIAHSYHSRLMAHGQDDATAIVGIRGKLTVNASLSKDLVNLYHDGRITREVQASFWDQFERAFAREMTECSEAYLLDKVLPLQLETALKAVFIVVALQKSLVTDKKVRCDYEGERIDKALL